MKVLAISGVKLQFAAHDSSRIHPSTIRFQALTDQGPATFSIFPKVANVGATTLSMNRLGSIITLGPVTPEFGTIDIDPKVAETLRDYASWMKVAVNEN